MLFKTTKISLKIFFTRSFNAIVLNLGFKKSNDRLLHFKFVGKPEYYELTIFVCSKFLLLKHSVKKVEDKLCCFFIKKEGLRKWVRKFNSLSLRLA